MKLHEKYDQDGSPARGKGGEIKAVDDLTLEVYEGETFGLLGPNAACEVVIECARINE